MAPTELVQSGGTYRIVNFKSKTLVDLSQADHSSIIGWPRNDAENQHWTVCWGGDAWHIQSPNGMYLGLGGSGQPADGVPLVAKPDRTGWHIWHDNANPDTY
ncbi:hypothetical protein V5O48_019648, partial [Marasmius crinis-equi]